MQLAQHVESLLLRCPYPGENRPRLRNDLVAIPQYYPSLVPGIVNFADQGSMLTLCCLDGTLPIIFKGNSYNIPIRVILPRVFPLAAPYVYVIAVDGMVVKPNKYANPDGGVKHDYLTNWNPRTSGIGELLNLLSRAFSEVCPVYSAKKTKGQMHVSEYNTKARQMFDKIYIESQQQIQQLVHKRAILQNQLQQARERLYYENQQLPGLQGYIENLRKSNLDVESRILKSAHNHQETSILDEVAPKMPREKQIFELISVEQAYENSLEVLNKLYSDNRIDSQKYFKNVREISKKIFMVARLRDKALGRI
jgi:hypothetical protein